MEWHDEKNTIRAGDRNAAVMACAGARVPGRVLNTMSGSLEGPAAFCHVRDVFQLE